MMPSCCPTIRQAGVEDIAVLTHLIRESFKDVAVRFGLNETNCPKHPSNYTQTWLQRDIDRGVVYYILEKDGQPMGCGALEKADDKLCYLERLAVLPDFRDNGFGQALAEHLFSEASTWGLRQVSIGIIGQDHHLKQWYQKLGFVEGETKDFAHLPFSVTFMMKSLSSSCKDLS
jgi:N-acetylglutamate synthase-like GNAT family acetyltransferase